uniref:Uncharacterized protein n=1 Tax=Pristionchus pacificus TaxID=54126 RepID=A0A2A6BQE7_PRIPA
STVPQATDLPHLNHEAALATAEGHDELLARERRRRLLAGHELNDMLVTNHPGQPSSGICDSQHCILWRHTATQICPPPSFWLIPSERNSPIN